MSISEAFANVRRAQERLNCWPNVYVSVNGEGYYMGRGGTEGKTPVLACKVPHGLLGKILAREVHWNNAEIGCLIRFDRFPNVYSPDVHTLLCFFHT